MLTFVRYNMLIKRVNPPTGYRMGKTVNSEYSMFTQAYSPLQHRNVACTESMYKKVENFLNKHIYGDVKEFIFDFPGTKPEKSLR